MADGPGAGGTGPRRTKVLLKGGCVLTLGTRTPNHPTADVLIEDGVVADIGSGIRSRDAEVVDATDAIVMPGFVDPHRHLWKTLFRQSEVLTAAEPYVRHYRPDDVYAATLLGLLSSAQAGITTVADWSDVTLDDHGLQAALQAHADAGLRTVLVHAAAARGEEGDAAALRRLASDRSASRSMTTIAYGSQDPASVDLSALDEQWVLPRRLGLRIHAHVGLAAGDRDVVAALGGHGLLDRDVTLVHCSDLSDADLDAIAASGAGVALAPAADMASGRRLPLQRFIDRGIAPGLSVGDEVAAPGDLFAQMRAAQSLQHATHFDLKLAGKGGLPALLTTRDVIRHATIDGAHALGLADVTGSIERGKQADIIVLRTNRPNVFPINDPIGAVVWAMDPSNVDAVFVAGRPIVRDGELQSDVVHVRKLAVAARQRLAGTTGQLLDSSAGGLR